MSATAINRPPRIAVALVAGAAVVMLVPMLWVVILSFKDNTALMANTSSAFAPPWTLANYRSIVGEGQVFTWLMNSVIVSACCCSLRWPDMGSRDWSFPDAGCCSRSCSSASRYRSRP
jgi:ABC-type glycerol-3-phosphate transport system permease component